MSLYLVTGGAGFIGSHIVKRLLKLHEKVRVIDNLSTGRLDNLSPVLNRIEFIEGDINDFYTLERAMNGVDYVIHQAAKVSVPESVKAPVSFHEANVNGTMFVLECCRSLNVKRLVMASSSAVYGLNEQIPLQEENPVIQISPYGMTKYIDELYAGLYYNLYGLETVCLRYFNVYGPGQNIYSPYAGVISKFINRMVRDEPVEIFGDGEQTRDFVYIDDVVNANLLSCWQVNLGGEILNIGSGCRVSINQLHAILSDILGVKKNPKYKPYRIGDISHSEASIEKATRVIGYKPLVNLKCGLQNTVDWVIKDFKNNDLDLKVV